MTYTALDLELARRHVAEGSARIARQRLLLLRMGESDLPTGQAETLLELLEQTQAEFERHLEAMEAEASET